MRSMTQGERDRCSRGECPGCGKKDCLFAEGPKAHGGQNVFTTCGRRLNLSPSITAGDGAPLLAEIDSEGPTYEGPKWHGLWPIWYWRRERRQNQDRWGWYVRAYYICGMHVRDRFE